MKDPAEFRRKLSSVLDISEERAGILLENLPATIGERLTKAELDGLVQKLSSIQALFLVEQPNDEDEQHTGAPRPPAITSTGTTADLKDEAASKFWLWSGCAALVFLVVFGFFAYLKSYSRVKESQIPKLPLVQLKSGVKDAELLNKRSVELEESISDMESELRGLDEKRRNAKADLNAVLRRNDMNPTEAKRLDRLHYGLQLEAGSLEKKLMKARKELDSLRNHSQ